MEDVVEWVIPHYYLLLHIYYLALQQGINFIYFVGSNQLPTDITRNIKRQEISTYNNEVGYLSADMIVHANVSTFSPPKLFFRFLIIMTYILSLHNILNGCYLTLGTICYLPKSFYFNNRQQSDYPKYGYF